MLTIKYKYHSPELIYSLDILLIEFLGIDYQLKQHSLDLIEINRINSEGKITLDAIFFKKLKQKYLKVESLPELPLQQWAPNNDGIKVDLIYGQIPIIYGKPGLKKVQNNHLHLNLDIFGSAFFMLSRYEELINPHRDEHNRFPATESLAYKEQFLQRPIVDEYVEILWAALSSLWPELSRKKHLSRTNITCDVDQPFDCTTKNFKQTARTCFADVIKRKSPITALERINRYFFNKAGNYRFDPYYTFDWYMDICDKNELQVTFYFIPESTEENNGCYKINEKKIIALMREIAERGHHIGVHGSYYTYNDASKILRQKDFLQDTLNKENIAIQIKGNRQHYLRWDTCQTPEHLNNAGFHYDTSGGFPDQPGFKYGTSKEFCMWGSQKRRALKLKQKPLVIMECSIIDEYFMGLNSKQAKTLIFQLKENAIKYGGDFNILWHNSYLIRPSDKKLFEHILKKKT